MEYTIGIDVGSASTKGIVLDEKGTIAARAVLSTGAQSRDVADTCIAQLLTSAGLRKADIAYIVSTGYGRNNVVLGNKKVTEIQCHARGALFLFKDTRTILDVGGQDTKATSLDVQGQVLDFAMNDKCAAGTGRFLEVMAGVLAVPIDALAKLASQADRDFTISNVCTVFAESEVISLIHEGCSKANIARALHASVVERAVALLRRVGVQEPITLTGGVMRNHGVVDLLKKHFQKINIPEDPQIVGALGAALIARERKAQRSIAEIVSAKE